MTKYKHMVFVCHVILLLVQKMHVVRCFKGNTIYCYYNVIFLFYYVYLASLKDLSEIFISVKLHNLKFQETM